MFPCSKQESTWSARTILRYFFFYFYFMIHSDDDDNDDNDARAVRRALDAWSRDEPVLLDTLRARVLCVPLPSRHTEAYATRAGLFVTCSALRAEQLALVCDAQRCASVSRTTASTILDTLHALAQPGADAFFQPGAVRVAVAHPTGVQYAARDAAELLAQLCALGGRVPLCLCVPAPDNDEDVQYVTLRERQLLRSVPPAEARLPIAVDDAVLRDTRVLVYSAESLREPHDSFLAQAGQYVALVRGEVAEQERVFLRVHSECLTGEILGSRLCECREQLHAALRHLRDEPRGILLYVQAHEGRGIGLYHKVQCYALQQQADGAHDTFQANAHLHLPDDCRDYAAVRRILRQLRVRSVHLYTSNPAKSAALGALVAQVSPLHVGHTEDNRRYVDTKLERWRSFH